LSLNDRTCEELDASDRQPVPFYPSNLVGTHGVPIIALGHRVHPHSPILVYPCPLLPEGDGVGKLAGVVNPHKTNRVQTLHGGSNELLFLLRIGLGEETVDHVHRIVAEDAHARLPNNLAARDVLDRSGLQEFEDGVGDPGAVDVNAIQANIQAIKAWVAHVILEAVSDCQEARGCVGRTAVGILPNGV
jgi:hypothetical protein